MKTKLLSYLSILLLSGSLSPKLQAQGEAPDTRRQQEALLYGVLIWEGDPPERIFYLDQVSGENRGLLSFDGSMAEALAWLETEVGEDISGLLAAHPEWEWERRQAFSSTSDSSRWQRADVAAVLGEVLGEGDEVRASSGGPTTTEPSRNKPGTVCVMANTLLLEEGLGEGSRSEITFWRDVLCGGACTAACCNPCFYICPERFCNPQCPEYDPCVCDPCFCDPDPCCGNPDPCCNSPDPCCGNPDPCCGSTDPCCGNPDPCCGSTDPCCGNPDPCCGSTDPCCGNPDPCCNNPDPCCPITDPCDPLCGNPCICDPCGCNPCSPLCGDPACDPACGGDPCNCDPCGCNACECTECGCNPDCCGCACDEGPANCDPYRIDECSPCSCPLAALCLEECGADACAPMCGGDAVCDAECGGDPALPVCTSNPDHPPLDDPWNWRGTTHPGSGNVHIAVPVFTSFAGGQASLEFALHYNSRRVEEVSGLGKGWTHSYNIYTRVFPPDGSTDQQIVVYDGQGRRHSYLAQGDGTYKTPAGRKATLTWVTDHYELHYWEGTRWVFRASSTSGRYHIDQVVSREGRITRFEYAGPAGLLSKITDPWGHTVQLAYDPAGGLPWQITHPDNKQTTLAYQNGTLASATDPLGKLRRFEYEAATAKLVTDIRKNGNRFTTLYGDATREHRDSAGELMYKVAVGRFIRNPDPLGSSIPSMYMDGEENRWSSWLNRHGQPTVQYTPDPDDSPATKVYGATGTPEAGYVIEETDHRGSTDLFEYDAFGNITRHIDPMGNELARLFADPNWLRFVTTEIEPDLDEWSYTYDPNTGDLLTITDPLNRVIAFNHEYYGPTEGAPEGESLPGRRKFRELIDRNGHKTRIEFDTLGHLTKRIADPDDLNLVTEYTNYDGMGRPGKVIQHRGPGDTAETTYAYDDMGRLTRGTVDPTSLNLQTSYTYDGSGNLLTVTDPRSVVTKYEYDHRNRLTKAFEDFGGPNQALTQYAYDKRDLVTQIIDANNHTTTFEYNDRGQLVKSTDAEGYETHYEPDAEGNLRTARRNLQPGPVSPQQVRSFAYDGLGRMVSRSVDPDDLSLTTLYEYTNPADPTQLQPATPGTELVHKVTDPRGKLIYLHYDSLDRLSGVVFKIADAADNGGDADDSVYALEYDAVGNRTALVYPEGERLQFSYDAADRLTTRAIDPAGENLQIGFGYDGADNINSVLLPNGNTVTVTYDGANRLDAATDSLGLIVDYDYDPNGNVTKRTNGLSHFWAFQYDSLNRLTQVLDPIVEVPTDKFREYRHDAKGNRTLAIANNGVQTEFAYDDIDRLLQTIEDFGGTDLATQNTTTTYTYDGASQLLSLADHDGNATTYDYDLAGRNTKVSYPDNLPAGAGEVLLGYDAAQNLTSRLDQSGVLTTYQYSDLNKVTRVSYSTGSLRQFEYDLTRRLTRAWDIDTERRFVYDALGRLQRSELDLTTTPLPTQTTSLAYTISPGLAQRVIAYPTSRTVTEDYDERFRLDTVSSPGLGTVSDWAYDLANRPESRVLGNGITTTFGFDLADRLSSLQHAKDAATIFHQEYGWNEIDSRTYTRNLVDSTASELYNNDARDRLRLFERGTLDPESTAITTPTPSSYLIQSKDWSSLDSRGNWLSSLITIDSQQSTDSRQANGVNEYTEQILDGQPPITPAYDAKGNLLDDGEQTYTYDEENRLTVVRDAGTGLLKLEVGYDVLGDRAGTRADGSQITFHVSAGGPSVLAEYDAAGNMLREFIYGRDFLEPLAMVDHTDLGDLPAGQAEPFYYLQDVLRSVVALTDSTGMVVERYEYEPYGATYIVDPVSEMSIAESAFGNPLAWTGQRYDAGVDLYHFQYRTYSPALGRWLQRDPIGYAAGSISLYEYAFSSAMNYFDPLGLDVVLGGGVSGGGGGVSGRQQAEQKLQEGIDALGEEMQQEPDQLKRQKLRQKQELLEAMLRRLRGTEKADDDTLLAAHGHRKATDQLMKLINQGSGVAVFVGELVQDIAGTAITLATPMPGDELAMMAVVGSKLGLGKKLKGAWRWVKGRFGRGKAAKGANAARGATRPKGVPKDWIAKPSKAGGGTRFVDPKNPHNSVRVMPGNPNSPYPNSRQPYVRHTRNGQSLDVNGNPVPKNTHEAHIPLGDFVWPF